MHITYMDLMVISGVAAMETIWMIDEGPGCPPAQGVEGGAE